MIEEGHGLRPVFLAEMRPFMASGHHLEKLVVKIEIDFKLGPNPANVRTHLIPPYVKRLKYRSGEQNTTSLAPEKPEAFSPDFRWT